MLFELHEIRKRGGKYEVVAVNFNDAAECDRLRIMGYQKKARYIGTRVARSAEHAVNMYLGKEF